MHHVLPWLWQAALWRLIGLAGGLALEVLFGDRLLGRYHPALVLDRAARRAALWLRTGRRSDVSRGAVFTIALVLAPATAALAMELAASRVSPWLGAAAAAALIWPALGISSLLEGVHEIADALRTGIDEARAASVRIVGPELATLDMPGLARAVVESAGEDLLGSFISPLLWAALLGPAGAVACRGAGIVASATGARSAAGPAIPGEELFGAFATRLHRMIDWLPGRLAVGWLTYAAALTKGDARGAWRTALRDGKRHPGMNAARVKAAMAGALRLRLGGPRASTSAPESRAGDQGSWDAHPESGGGGPGSWDRPQSQDPYLGDGRALIRPEDLVRATRLLEVGAALSALDAISAVAIITIAARALA